MNSVQMSVGYTSIHPWWIVRSTESSHMTSNITRRQVARTAAWAAPAVALATAAPASAASKPKKPLRPDCVEWSQWNVRYDHVEYVGIDGFLGTVSWWIVVDKGYRPVNGCPVPKRATSHTTTVDVIRQEGGLNRWRTVTLHQNDPVTTAVRTHDVAEDPTHPAGSLDYQWTITFKPQDIYNLNRDHRAYVTLHPGDGGLTDGRIKNNLYIDGVLQTFSNQGDQTF